MNCQEIRRLLPAYVDQQLGPNEAPQLAAHLAACPACSAEFTRLNSLRDALRTQGTRYVAPGHLRQRIQAAIRQPVVPVPPRRLGQRLARLPWAWINLGLATACSAALAAVLLLPPSAGPEMDQLAQELTDSHFRSLLADHLADVASSDQHTVKPWFTGKLDFAPPVHDFAEQGYPLVGGRLDYVEQRTVAALAYRHKRHVLNLFIWPTRRGQEEGAQRDIQRLSKQGYQLAHWSRAGLQYWLISDMSAGDLMEFEGLLLAQVDQDAASPR